MVDWKVHTYTLLPSTQVYVRELAEEGLPEGTVVQAMIQNQGKGRQGRVWNSPIGNLYMSALLRPDCTAMQAGQMAFVTAVAVADAMVDFVADGAALSLKWPNDVLIDGKKAAGILIESVLGEDGKIDAVVIGIGVNVVSPPEGFAGLKPGTAVHPFRDRILAELAAAYKEWREQGFVPIRERWLARAHGKGQMVKSQSAEGIFRDLNPDGALVITMANGRDKFIHAGDVFFEQADAP